MTVVDATSREQSEALRFGATPCDADRLAAPPPVVSHVRQEQRPTTPPKVNRDRYIDTLRAVAMVRVVTLHSLGWAILPLIFPSMGVMFALAGSLVASSLDRGRPLQVIYKRVRRLLPSIWVMGAIMLPIMLAAGWTSSDDGVPVGLSLAYWVVPLATPPGSDWGTVFSGPLWYLTTFTWLVILSPTLLWLFRRWPIQTMIAPLIVLGLYTSGVVTHNGSRTDDLMISLGTYTACWLLGFALHDDRISRIRARTAVGLSFVLLSGGFAWAYSHQLPESGWNIDAIPIANAFYCLGAVLLMLRFRPNMNWLARAPILDKLVTTMNSRALTIYLWGNVAIVTALYIERNHLSGSVYAIGSNTARISIQYTLTWVLIAMIVLSIGWVEDVGARRRIRINPWPQGPKPPPRMAANGNQTRPSPRRPLRRQADSARGMGSRSGRESCRR